MTMLFLIALIMGPAEAQLEGIITTRPLLLQSCSGLFLQTAFLKSANVADIRID